MRFVLPWRRERPKPETFKTIEAITPPTYTFIGHDESLHVKAVKRREIAASIKKRSALVASGSSAGSVLKIQRREG